MLAVLLFGGLGLWAAEVSAPTVLEALDVAPVWSAHPVNFALLTDGAHGLQYVAYYDQGRRMTVASRRLDSGQWTFVPVPEKAGGTSAVTGWDSHNYIAMAVDAAGRLHLSGNMHCQPLLYARTATPGDLSTLERIDRMLPDREARVTYPRFIQGAGRTLVFAYRDGGSGNGADLYNAYDPELQAWRRLLDRPLFDGRGKMNAYSVGPVLDSAGMYHAAWVWRDSPDASTNHDVSYARSRDLVHWEDSSGRPLALPITQANGEVVDPVPAKGGTINNLTKIGFDTKGRLVVSYIKYDANGKTQAYAARRAATGWDVVQVSAWDYRWEFGGGGSLKFEVDVGSVQAQPDGRLELAMANPRSGAQLVRLDPETLRPVAIKPKPPLFPPELQRPESAFPGMQVKSVEDSGTVPEKNVRYVLRWETLPENRDLPRPGPLPPPTMLRVCKLATP